MLQQRNWSGIARDISLHSPLPEELNAVDTRNPLLHGVTFPATHACSVLNDDASSRQFAGTEDIQNDEERMELSVGTESQEGTDSESAVDYLQLAEDVDRWLQFDNDCK